METLFFLFRGLRRLWCKALFPDLWCIPTKLCSHGNGIHHSFCFSVTAGSGDRPREEGCHGGGVYFFSLVQRYLGLRVSRFFKSLPSELNTPRSELAAKVVADRKSRAAKWGGFKRGCFPIWTCPSFFVLFGGGGQSQKGPRHNPDLSRKKWETPRF